MNFDPSKYIKAGSLYFAAFLFAKGAELADIEVNHGQVIFCFFNSPECEIWSERFKRSAEALIDARLYSSAIRILSSQRRELLMKLHAGKS